MAARKAAAKKASGKNREPLIAWKADPHGFTGTVEGSDIVYRVASGYTADGEFTWVTTVQLSDDEARTLEDAQQLAEDDLS